MENKELEKEIEQIKQRNQKVELDKKWETSKINNIFLSSLVPVIGFTLSTISLNFIRKLWEK